MLAASVFQKSLTDPIELISFSAANRSFVQPVNYGKGRPKGFELEGRTELEMLNEHLKHFFAGGNFTWLDSSVDVPAEEREPLASSASARTPAGSRGSPRAS